MKQILIYDPGSKHLNFFTSNLKKDYSVHGFSTIEDAVKYLAKVKADVSFLCLSDGLNARHLKLFKDATNVIGILGKDAGSAMKDALKSGVEDFIILPCSPFELKLKVECCLHRKNRLEKLESEKKRLETINETVSMVSSTLDPQEMLFYIVKKIAEVIPVVRCSMIQIDSEDDNAHVVATSENPKIRDIPLKLEKYPEIREAILTRVPVIVNDIKTDPIMTDVRDIISPLGIRSIIVLPIFYKDTAIGTLFLRTSRSSRSFTKEEIEFCSTVTNACANAIYSAFLHERVEHEKASLGKLAITDFLTGLYNVRYFYHRIEEEFLRAQRYKLPLTCLMVDIDLFKRINDTYSHRVGDMVLKEFAHILKKNIRRGDILARYGGEEFIFLLPNTTREGSISASEKLRLCVKDHRFKSLGGAECLTISIGIATYPHERINNGDDLITYADNALLDAKNRGRNQVVIHS